MKTRRIGRFEIDRARVDYAPKQCLAILLGMIVVRAELQFHSDTIAYMAIGDQFEEMPPDSAVPEYDYEIKDLIGGKYHVVWSRRP